MESTSTKTIQTKPRGVEPALNVWSWALWFAVLLGLSQAAFIAVIRAVNGRLILISSNVVWMAPIANAVIYLAAALILYAITKRVQRGTAILVVMTAFIFLGLLGPILIVPGLSPYAGMILAAGISVQGARVIRSRFSFFNELVRITLPVVIGVCIAIGLGLALAGELRAHSREAALATPPAESPNVLFIVLDTVRAKSLSLYGYERQTSPHLDAFAASGVVFDNAISTAPWTLPSHASFFTGLQPEQLSADWLRPLDGGPVTLAEEFQLHGYATAGFVANLIYGTKESGLNRGFIRYSDFPISLGMIFRDSYLARALFLRVRGLAGETDPFIGKTAAQVTDEFLAWAQKRPQKPFFAFLNYFDAHSPYVVPEPFDKKFGSGGRQPFINLQRTWPPEQTQKFIDAYDSAVAYVDGEVGRLLDSMKAQGLLENTVVIITADHGEQLGEHTLFDHANSLYRPLVHVPLVVVMPNGARGGRRISTPVSLIDLPATALDVAGIAGSRIPGHSLAVNWTGVAAPEHPRPIFAMVNKSINMPEWLPASKGPMQSVLVDGMRYILNGDGREEMYDFVNDREELHDLASDPQSHALLESARRALREKLDDKLELKSELR